jgi:uncharacterized membrane protein
MTALTACVAVIILAAIAFLFVMHRASRRPTTPEFDGGFDHENGTRITKVRGMYIIHNDGEDQ